MSAPTLPWLEDLRPHDFGRWAVAAAVVLGLHLAAVAFVVTRPEPVEIGDDSDVVTVGLAPIDSTPNAVATDAAPAPENMVEAKAVPRPEKEEPKEPPKLEQPRDETPGTVALADAKPVEKVEAAQPPAPRTAEQVKGAAPRIEPSWRTSLMRALQRAKRYPAEARARNEQGVVLLSFSIDRSGRVLAHRIAKSSGYAVLDNEALAIVMRAEPLPPFPATMSESKLNLTIPIRFSLR
jgi:periplasmic protein TonB